MSRANNERVNGTEIRQNKTIHYIKRLETQALNRNSHGYSYDK